MDCLKHDLIPSLCWKCAFNPPECDVFLKKVGDLNNLLSSNFPILKIRFKVIECNKFRRPSDVRDEKFRIKILEQERIKLAKPLRLRKRRLCFLFSVFF